MNTIDFDIWEPNPERPGTVRRVGQRAAQEVFAELQHRLESTGYLPDEYFLMADEWRNGKEIPEGAYFYCNVDYGGSEGVYLDVCLKWYDKQTEQNITRSFITGKTLGETGSDLDRMYLIASAVTKAFNGDRAAHARYIRLGEPDAPNGMTMHLNQEEQRLLIDSLVERRNGLQKEFTGVEQLLRRVTGSITEFINEVGERPLKISDYDMAVLAIEDGDLPAFQAAYAKVPDKAPHLLLLAAGRPGTVGRKMTMLVLADAKELTGEQYLGASKRAVDTGDVEKVRLFYEQAERCVADLPKTYYGDVISHAYGEKNHIAKALLMQATPEQIAGASPHLLQQVAFRDDYSTVFELVKKGIHTDEVAADMIRAFQRSPWAVTHLLEQGMEIEPHNYGALHACINAGNTEAAKMLLDRGMDFGNYTEWRRNRPIENNEAFEAVQEHWKQNMDGPNAEQQQAGIPQIGGM
ncbi:MAG: ankyrin repeat domain-containing protein [Oscillospiraceae bacterium]|nr:ankyrin repeat domain-containing protein [Oscillospiraceae bacterium]